MQTFLHGPFYPNLFGVTAMKTPLNGVILLDMPLLIKSTTLSRSLIYKKIQNGSFPRPIKIGRSARWVANEIISWIESQAISRPQNDGGKECL